MEPRELYRQIFGIEEPWIVSEVRLDAEATELHVTVSHRGSNRLACPECGTSCAGYDHTSRTWRHLDTCQHKTLIHCDVPRVDCPEHGVRAVSVPWAVRNSRFTLLFEAFAIDMLGMLSMSDASRMLRIGWDALDGIRSRAVARGLERRREEDATRIVRHLSIDETSFAKRHEYVTVVSDQETGAVLHVSDGHSAASLEDYFRGLTAAQKKAIRTVSIDMSKAYIKAVREHLPEAKICFDKYHIAAQLSKAVDQVRRQEQKVLRSKDDTRLNRSRTTWLRNPDNMTLEEFEKLQALRKHGLKTGRAWVYKENAMTILKYTSRRFAEFAWKTWLAGASRTHLTPIKKVAGMVREHLDGIINAQAYRRTNALAESHNARIQKLKRRAHGYRNRARFREAILFELGQLDLYPRLAESTHSISG